MIVLASLATLMGCADRQESSIPPPAPVGMDIRAIQQRQIDGGLIDRFTVYRHEWFNDGDAPGAYGSRHLEEIASRVVGTNRPVLIETAPDAQLNESRRNYLVRYLAERHVPDPQRRVIVGRPAANGISGDEAAEIYEAGPTPSPASIGGSAGGASGRKGF